jgi:hypothetical protein
MIPAAGVAFHPPLRHGGQMYRVEYLAGDQWGVIDGRERTVFVGTKQQVEDWLDRQENIELGRSERSPHFSLYRRLVRTLRRLVRRGRQTPGPYSCAG